MNDEYDDDDEIVNDQQQFDEEVGTVQLLQYNIIMDIATSSTLVVSHVWFCRKLRLF